MNINRSSFNSVHGKNTPLGAQSVSSNHSSVPVNDTIQKVLTDLGISKNMISSLKVQTGSGTPLVMQGLDTVSQLQVNADTQHLLSQMGLVSSQISMAIALKGSATVGALRKKFSDLESHLSEPEIFVELCAALGIEESSESLVFIQSNGGLAVIESGLTSVSDYH